MSAKSQQSSYIVRQESAYFYFGFALIYARVIALFVVVHVRIVLFLYSFIRDVSKVEILWLTYTIE